MTRRPVLCFLSALAAVGLFASRADAHAEFVGAPAGVAPDRDVALTLNVPHERDDATYNVGVAIALPAGWSMASCQSKPTWTCASASDGGRAVVRFTKDGGAAPAEDESFRFTVHTGTEGGTFPLPTVQTYNTGEVVRWIEAAGSAEPAPSLTVSGSAPATTAATVATTDAPAPIDTTAATAAPATSAPATTEAPATTAAPTTTVVATTTTATATTTTVAAATTSAASTTIAAATTTSVVALGVTAAKGDDSGSNAGVIVVVVVLALVGAAGGFVWARKKRSAA